MTEEIVKYKAGDNTVSLSPNIIRKYLVSGEGKVTDQEIMMFLSLCQFQQLNPFLREVYLIKFGTHPATMVTGKETFLKRAYRHPKYRGHKTGIADDGQIAWAEVYVEGYQVSIRCEVDYKEYVGRKSNGEVNSMWKAKPNTMLKKVALVQALREAFPETFGGLYSQEEISTNMPLPSEPIGTNGSPIEVEYITIDMQTEINDLIKSTKADKSKVLKYLKAESVEKILLSDYGRAKVAFVAKQSVKQSSEREPGQEG